MATGDLTTLEAVKRDLGIKMPSDDALLKDWITGASQWVVTYCNQSILTATYAWVTSGRGSNTLMLPYSPVTAISSLKVDGQPILPGAAGAATEGFFFNSRGLVTLRGLIFTRGTYNVEVGYAAGYASSPPQIERAVARMVGWRFRERDRLGQSSKSVGGETVAYQTAAASEEVLKVLDNFRRVVPA